MRQGSDSRKYIRLNQSENVWGLTYKCGSTSMLKALQGDRAYTDLRPGDHVRILVRDPRDRLVSAWAWFTKRTNSYFPELVEKHPFDHDFLLDEKSPFKEWVLTALRHWNPHWVPQTEIHPRWREFELIRLTDIHTLGWGHEKKTRPSNAWEQYYDEDLLELVDEIYAEDLEMWKEVEDGIDTRTRRVL